MDAQQKQAYTDAAVEMGKSIAIGAVPFVGQAIDAYDTLESCWRIYGAKQAEDKENAKFDLVLAIVGWIPGPGDGVKKSLRLVNKDPARYAPILFDLLRHVCELAGIKTSPEALLDAVFDAGKLRAQMSAVREGVQDFSGYKALPDWGQQAITTVLKTAEAELPAMIGIVQRRLTRWKRHQPNSSARASTTGRAKTPAVQPKDASVAKEGASRPTGGSHGQSLKSTLATAALEIGNAAIGVAGEHIADYYCANTLGWAKGWSGHDKGLQGQWSDGTPSEKRLGKLSKGGSDPKTPGILYKLGDGANGAGIDAVWHVSTRNLGKPYAVVEAKSDFEVKQPAFIKRNPSTGKKPGVTAKLGVSGVPTLENMLTSVPAVAGGGGGRPGSGKPGGGGTTSGKPKTTAKSSPSVGDKSGPIVQMSREWVEKNVKSAVPKSVALQFIEMGDQAYSRHLIYTPMWLPAMTQHAKAIAEGSAHQEATHRDHDVLPNLHYEDTEVKAAVNKKKANLRLKFPMAATLRAEA